MTTPIDQFKGKQLDIINWWRRYPDKQTIIADGAVRSGKTFAMSISYVLWSMIMFDHEQFGIAGKTIGSLRRNVIRPLKQTLQQVGFSVVDRRSENMLEISIDGRTNLYYLFGGKDESSQDLIQGITLAGMFFDEAALMPQSFVNQATARVSVTGGKYWFNMNPEGPYHWFKTDWIDQADDKRALRLHFVMTDNPSLSDEVIDRYEHMYSGVFYQRYILGQWVLADGIVYDNFNKDEMVSNPSQQPSRYYVSVDYGTQNPTAFLLWGKCGSVWYCLKEYYYDGRHSSRQKTDDEYARDFSQFVGDIRCEVIVDPSAASFIAKLRERQYRVIKADNDVLNGIRETQTAMNSGEIKFTPGLTNLFKEFASYVWDDKASQKGEDKVVKAHDHAMDAMRYFVMQVIKRRNAAHTFKNTSKFACVLGRHSSRQKTDDEYARDFSQFVGDIRCEVIVDPSAASFIAKLRERQYRVIKADNDVLNGIRETQTAMNSGEIKFTPGLTNLFKEFASYVWDDKASQKGEDKVVKAHDHAMDAMRYFVMQVIKRRNAAHTFKNTSKYF